MVCARSDTTDAGHNAREFLDRAALAEALKAAQLGDLEIGILYLALVIQEDFDLPVAFQAGYRIYGDTFHTVILLVNLAIRDQVSGIRDQGLRDQESAALIF
jgi:hypothetical protein